MEQMFKLILTFTLVVLFHSSYPQCKSDLEKENIQGNVKKIIETGIFVKEGTNEINYIQTTNYDNKGKALGYTFAHKNDKLKPTKTIFEFNKKGHKVRENRFDLNDQLEDYITYKYDSRGNVVKEKYFIFGGHLDSYSLYEYNSTSDRIESKTFYSNGALWLWHKSTYQDGKLIEVFDPQDSTSLKFTNDIHGNKIQYVEYDKFGAEKKVNVYAYAYDDKSNWTKKTTYINGEIYWIDERQYEYY